SPRNRLARSLDLSHVPRWYLGELTDRDESVIAGRRVRNSVDYAETAYGIRLEQALWGGRASVDGSLERIHRDYNVHFPERDNDNDQFRLGATVYPFPGWGANVRVSWLRGDLNARGEIPDTLGVNDVDISYDHDGVGVLATLPWSHGGWRGRLDASRVPEERVFTDSDKFDVTRFGRVARRLENRVRVT